MGEWERQPQNDTPMRLREGSLGIREVVGKSVVGESRIGGRMELGGSWEELSSQSVETWGSCLALAGQREGAAG